MEINEESLRNTLKRYWGYSIFRPQQLESCQHILRGNDVVALMATGSGKSLIYQLPSVALRETGLRATTLVISPLIALIEDQVTSMKALGISVGGIGGNFDYKSELCAQNGDYAILYSTPEKILCWQHGLDQLMKNTKLVCLAIDESHCVSEWGHDFRPHYRRLSEIRDWFQLQRIPIVALTATATPLILNDIITNLKLIQPYIARTTLNRKNIKYMIRTRTGFSDLLLLFIELRQQQLTSSNQHFPPTLVYVNTKKDAEDLTMKTRESQHQHLQGLAISFYHAGMTLNDRSRVQSDFMENKLNIVVATVAFGLGINKPDIRVVINFGMSKAIESYYQQTGRAGRDGDPSYAYLLYNRQDSVKLFGIVKQGDNVTIDARIQAQISAMSDYCKLVGCRRKYLLNYLGEVVNDSDMTSQYCKNSCCDWCDENFGSSSKKSLENDDGDWITCDSKNRSHQKINLGPEIILILNTIIDLGEFYGISIPIGILCGSHEKSIRDKIVNYTKMRTFGKGSKHSREYWKALANQLTDAEGMIETVFTKSNTFAFERYKVTDKGRTFLNKSRNVNLDEESFSNEYFMEPKGRFLELHIMDVNKSSKLPPPQRDYSMYQRNYNNKPLASVTVILSDEEKAIAEHEEKRMLFEEEMRKVRGEVAKRVGTNAYNVLSSNDVNNLVNSCPCSIEELKQVEGWTDWKVRLYGEDFISAIKIFIATNNYQVNHSSSTSSSSAPFMTMPTLTKSSNKKENKDTNIINNDISTNKKTVSTVNIYKPLYMNDEYNVDTKTNNDNIASSSMDKAIIAINDKHVSLESWKHNETSRYVENHIKCSDNHIDHSNDDDNFESFVPSFSIRSGAKDDQNAWINDFLYNSINNGNKNQESIISKESEDVEINSYKDTNMTDIITGTSSATRCDTICVPLKTGYGMRRKDEELLFDGPIEENVITKISPITKVNTDETLRMKKKRKSLFGNMNFQYNNDAHDNDDNDNVNNNDIVNNNDNIDNTNITKSPLNLSDME